MAMDQFRYVPDVDPVPHGFAQFERIERLDGFADQITAAFGVEREIACEHHLVGTVSLRFIYLGMIAEVARHAGHADILAEQIQAATKSSAGTSEQTPNP